MAQSGFTPIQLYRSTTAAAVPLAGNLAAGELAINLTDEKLYFKNAAGVVKVLTDAAAAGTVTSVAASGGTTGLTFTGSPITSSGTLTLSGTLAATNGGTGQSSYTIGDILFASTSTALSKLADVATGNALISGGVGVAPAYGKIGLTTHVSGTLPVASGGTGQTTYTDGQLLIGNTTGNTLAKATLTAGSGITITNGSGAITIAATGTALTNWTEAVNTSAPNATVPVVSFTATNAATNVDAAIVPKGTGALVAQVADNTATGGNKRGTNAVDWQTARGLNTQVASGVYAVVSGGFFNVASGSTCVVGGGQQNSATANSCTVGGGQFNAASTLAATVCGGSTNTASGEYSTVVGGANNLADAIYSSASGNYATTRLAISQAFGQSPIAASAGVSQKRSFILGRQTTDITATVLTTNGSAASSTNQVNLVNNSAFYFQGVVIANVTGGGNTKGWDIEGVIKRGANAASTALVGTATVTSGYADAGASTWTVTVTADTTNGCLAITVAGQAATTIRWVANIETTEVTY